MAYRNILKLEPIVRTYLRPVPSLIPRREIYRKNDFFDVVNDINRTVKEVERAFSKIQRDGLREGVVSGLYNLTRSHELPIIVNEDGTRLLRLRFDLEGFSPENIKLTIKDRLLTIQAKQGSEKTYNNQMKLYKDYHYEYTLPEDVDIEKITSKQNSDGILLVEAILPKVEHKDQSVEIPIQKS